MVAAKNRSGAHKPSGLDTQNMSMVTAPTPTALQNDVVTRIFFLATRRSSGRPPLALSPFAGVVPLELAMSAVNPFFSNDLLMVRSSDVPHLRTSGR